MKSLYLIFGEERYLILREIARLRAAFSPAEVETIENASPDHFAESITTPMLFAPKKMMILKDFTLTESDSLNFALKNIPENILVVIDSPQKLDKRKTIYKSISSIGEVKEFNSVPEWEIETVVSFINDEARERGKKIKVEAVELLLDSIGRNFGLLASEIEKLALYLGERGTIEKADVEAMVSRSGYDSFALVDGVRERNGRKAFEALKKLIEDKEEMVPLLGLVSSQVRTMYKIKLLGREAERRLKISPYIIRKCRQGAARYSEAELEGALSALIRCDLNLKSNYDKGREMLLLLSEIIGEKR